MIRFLNTYFPARMLLLGASEAVLTTAAFVFVLIVAMGPLNAQLFIGYEQGGDRIALVVCVFIVCMYYFDLYDSTVLRSQREASQQAKRQQFLHRGALMVNRCACTGCGSLFVRIVRGFLGS